MGERKGGVSDAETYDRHWLLWDGQCGFCRRAAEWVGRNDTRGRFRIVPFQDAPSPPMTDAIREASRESVHVVRTDGTVLKGGEASMFVLGELGWRTTAAVGSAPPFSWAVNLGYRVVARNRMLFSRFLFTRGRRSSGGGSSCGT